MRIVASAVALAASACAGLSSMQSLFAQNYPVKPKWAKVIKDSGARAD